MRRESTPEHAPSLSLQIFRRTPSEPYNQMQMELLSNAHIPDGLLASMTLLSEKPRQGVASWNPAPHQGIDERNCTAVLGLRFRCWEIVSGTVDAPKKIGQVLTCASELANNYSIAGVAGLTSDSFKSAHPTLASIGTGFLGNTFSGITDLGTHLYNTATQGGGGGDIATDLTVGGVGQGLPVGESAFFKGAAGITQDALVNVGEAGLADAFGFAKLGIDAVIYGASAIHCYNHP